jgi:hypothetical protein
VKRLVLLALALALAVAAPAAAAKPKHPKPPKPRQAKVTIQVGHLHGGKARILSTVPVTGTVKPFEPGQTVDVSLYLNGKRVDVKKAKVRASGGQGAFRVKFLVEEGGKYAVSAHLPASGSIRGDDTNRKSWRVSFPSLHRGDCGPVVAAFKDHMAGMGYVSGKSRCFNGRTGREVLAYRKVNGMTRNEHAGSGLVKRVFSGKGSYRVRHPDAGKHAEVPLSKQVLVLAKGDKPYAIYPVSTGKPSTPTITGHYYFYLRSPGYNSEGMYYSFYWHGGYAVHGYASVPNYAASHGCVRTYIADQPRIYNQLEYGESIFVF